MFYILGQLLGQGGASSNGGGGDLPDNALTLGGESLTLDGDALTIGS